jgi:hypothetical protein
MLPRQKSRTWLHWMNPTMWIRVIFLNEGITLKDRDPSRPHPLIVVVN